MAYFDEAEELASMETGYPRKRVYAVVMRCEAMIRYERYEDLRARLVPNLRFVEATLRGDGMVWLMEKMLSQLEYHDGNFKEAIESVFRALTLINREFLVSAQSIDALAAVADVLRRITARSMAPPFTL